MIPMKRKFALAAVLFTTSTGAVMASNTACRVVMVRELGQAQATVKRKVHHSAETLARWKVGAQAWSRAHGGKIYTGQPPAQGRIDWKPLSFQCDDVVALDQSRPDFSLMLAGETLPEFTGYGADVPESSLLAENRPPEGDATYGFGAPGLLMTSRGAAAGSAGGGGVGGGSGGGYSNTPVYAASIPPAASTPEPGGIFLVLTGMVAIWMAKGKWAIG